MKEPNLIPGWYAVLFARLAPCARDLGYALAIHGTLARDLDLIACPWVDEAVSADELAHAIAAHIGGSIHTDPNAQPGDFSKHNPQPKPHGRLGYSIQIGGGYYVDLSVMPRGGYEGPFQGAPA